MQNTCVRLDTETEMPFSRAMQTTGSYHLYLQWQKYITFPTKMNPLDLKHLETKSFQCPEDAPITLDCVNGIR